MDEAGRLHTELGERLHAAWTSHTPIAPLSADHDLTLDDAYRIQEVLVARLQEDGGGTQVGFKIGLTSRPMQRMLGVDQPDFAPVLSDMVHPDDHEIPLDEFIQPKVEAEIALVLDAPLQGPGVTTEQARAAIGGAVAAIEMVDSRIRDWKLTLADTVSDMASSGATIMSDTVVPIDGWDPRLTGMVVSRNGELVDTGAGAAALDDPVGAVAWLANTLAPWGIELQAGWFIMTGALHAAFDVARGDVVHAEFDRLGAVTARFV